MRLKDQGLSFADGISIMAYNFGLGCSDALNRLAVVCFCFFFVLVRSSQLSELFLWTNIPGSPNRTAPATLLLTSAGSIAAAL